ncbi:hypothetical protein FRX31_004316 [Thalictrum thalictroides]|uniref:Uncharacterized protein n=1 Tax=Thalictrum thalictroides TaxID=46969 RepID=A0A7J6XAY9_THATH|nr:hypothetical protein FRX31_004316 [Thalictrum thalictroides]
MREEFTRENVYETVKLVMDEGSEVGKQVRENHHKWKKFLLSEGIESSYIDCKICAFDQGSILRLFSDY